MKIKLATINLEVADPQRAKAFYVDALQMTEDTRRSHEDTFVYLKSDGADLTLTTPQEAPQPEPSRTMELGFVTDDLPALKAHLAAKGIDGVKPQSMGWAEVVEFHDPDGHRVIVYEFKHA